MQNPLNYFSIIFGNWFGNWFLFSGFSRILKNPLALFVYGILSKWYIAVMITAIVVTFWVFKGLNDTGVLKQAENVVFTALNDSKSVAKHCVPKVLNYSEFWYCLNNPPEYEKSESEKALEKQLNKDLHPGKSASKNQKNPYDE